MTDDTPTEARLRARLVAACAKLVRLDAEADRLEAEHAKFEALEGATLAAHLYEVEEVEPLAAQLTAAEAAAAEARGTERTALLDHLEKWARSPTILRDELRGNIVTQTGAIPHIVTDALRHWIAWAGAGSPLSVKQSAHLQAVHCFVTARRRADLYLPNACPADAAEALRTAAAPLLALRGWSDASLTYIGEKVVDAWRRAGSPPPATWVDAFLPAGDDGYRIVRIGPSGRAEVWGPLATPETPEPTEQTFGSDGDILVDVRAGRLVHVADGTKTTLPRAESTWLARSVLKWDDVTEQPDRREATLRAYWSLLGFGSPWIEDQLNRTNYLLDEIERRSGERH